MSSRGGQIGLFKTKIKLLSRNQRNSITSSPTLPLNVDCPTIAMPTRWGEAPSMAWYGPRHTLVKLISKAYHHSLAPVARLVFFSVAAHNSRSHPHPATRCSATDHHCSSSSISSSTLSRFSTCGLPVALCPLQLPWSMQHVATNHGFWLLLRSYMCAHVSLHPPRPLL